MIQAKFRVGDWVTIVEESNSWKDNVYPPMNYTGLLRHAVRPDGADAFTIGSYNGLYLIANAPRFMRHATALEVNERNADYDNPFEGDEEVNDVDNSQHVKASDLKPGERVSCRIEGIVDDDGLYITLNPESFHAVSISVLFAGEITRIPHRATPLEVGVPEL